MGGKNRFRWYTCRDCKREKAVQIRETKVMMSELVKAGWSPHWDQWICPSCTRPAERTRSDKRKAEE